MANATRKKKNDPLGKSMQISGNYGLNLKEYTSSLESNFQIQGSVNAKFPISTLTMHPETNEILKEYFKIKAAIKVFDKEMADILFFRALPDVHPRHRERYIQFFALIAKLFKQIGFHIKISEELINFAYALGDLDHGTVAHFLKPEKAENRSLDQNSIWTLRFYIVFLIEIDCHVLRISRRKASKVFAEKNSFLKEVVSPSSRDFVGAIDSWCKKFLSENIPSDHAQCLFNNRENWIKEARVIYSSLSGIQFWTQFHNDVFQEMIFWSAHATPPDVYQKLVHAHRQKTRTKAPPH
jgi:hypothetical protein